MEKFVKYFLFTLLVSSFILAGCSKDDDDDDNNDPNPPVEAAFDVLTDYMIANNMDASTVIDAWIIGAADVYANLDNFYIIDIRGADDYNAGHIEGAVNATLGTILDAAANATKPILVVCYTGQTAGHAVIALRLSGYSDAKVLKWGMSGWRADLSAPWANSTASIAVGDANWIYPASITPDAEFDAPTIETSFTEGADILAERVDALLANGFGPNAINGSDVLADPESYFINNYWALTDVEHYGHLKGAYRVQPFSLADEKYKNLDPSKTIVSYCWTGQTSSMLTAYLYILGYDVKSLKFGVNSLIYSELEGHNYTVPGTDLPVVTSK